MVPPGFRAEEEPSWDVLVSVGRIRSDFLEGTPLPNSHSAPPAPAPSSPIYPTFLLYPTKTTSSGLGLVPPGDITGLGAPIAHGGYPRHPTAVAGERGREPPGGGCQPYAPPPHLPIPRLTGGELIRWLLRRLLLAVAPEMTVKMGANAEAAAALRARERLLAAVRPPVLRQRRTVGKRLAAIRTGVPGPGVSPLVLMEVEGAVEALPAIGADVGLPARVGTLMPVEVGGPAEPFAAVPALVGSFAGMDPLVSFPMGAPGKTLPAITATVGFLTATVEATPVPGVLGAGAEGFTALFATERTVAQMEALVFDQCRPVAKTFPAQGALVGSLAGVGALVPVKMEGATKTTPAVGADVRATAGVGALVPVEVGAPAKTLTAFGTLVGLLPGMDTLVPVKMGAPAEALAAVTALEGQATGVQPLVGHQLLVTAEALAALFAFVRQTPGPRRRSWRARPFGGVSPLVPVEVGADVEALPAVEAEEGLLAGVGPPVLAEVGAAAEALAAFPALVTLLQDDDALEVGEGAGTRAIFPPAPSSCRAGGVDLLDHRPTQGLPRRAPSPR